MNFIFRLSLNELRKNKFKVLIAIIVSLILFMSAFTLCNIATALPSNFYNYYEQFMSDTIGIHIANADENLYNKKDNYFTEFDADFDIACNNYVLKFGDNEQLPYDENVLGVSTYYSNILLNSTEHSPEVYKTFIKEGDIWQTFEEDGIWIADFAKNKLGVEVGDVIEYNFNNTLIPLKVNGIIDSSALQKYLTEQSGSKARKSVCFITPTSARKILFESNTPYNAYGVVGKIDRLFDVYNDLSRNYSVTAGTAFSLVKQVKNAEVICYIVGIIMMIGGIIILLNFINMIISMNNKHISLIRILGAKSYKIMLAYYLIFMILITIVCMISWATLPLYNYLVSLYCANIGYPFSIGINYTVVESVFAVCYIITTCVMLAKWQIFDRTAPNQNILEED